MTITNEMIKSWLSNKRIKGDNVLKLVYQQYGYDKDDTEEARRIVIKDIYESLSKDTENLPEHKRKVLKRLRKQ